MKRRSSISVIPTAIGLWSSVSFATPSLAYQYTSFSVEDVKRAASNSTDRIRAQTDGDGSTSKNSARSSTVLPEGVTMCDGSEPVGLDAARTLAKPVRYCMNHGTCRDDYQNWPHQPCLCSSEFAGPHCEFPSGSVPATCRVHCFLGECVVGAKSFELVLSGDYGYEDMQYCDCGNKATGEYCEREAQPCGEGHCRNGGSCLTVELEDGSVQNFCDCTTSFTGPEAFAGQYCEHKVTTFCSKDVDANGVHFCVNNGVCRDDSYMGCACPVGFSGPLCEFNDEEVPVVYSACTLECQNNGVCRKGAKDVSFLEKFGMESHLDVQRFNNDFEHCVCPMGYAGLACEYEMEVCPGREVVCLGGSCNIKWNLQTPEVSCDCESSGQYCEIRSASEPETNNQSAVYAGIAVGITLLIVLLLTIILLHRRRKRRRIQRMRRAYNFNMCYTDSAPPPTLASIHQHQQSMTAEAGDFADVKLHELYDVPLDDEEDVDETDDASDERSTTCSYSPSDDTPTMTNVSYYPGLERRSLHFKSTRSNSAFLVYENDDEFYAPGYSFTHPPGRMT